MAEEMATALGNQTGQISGSYVLIESKSFQQARERTYLKWALELYPCRMKMKDAGWFITRNKNDELVSVCLYCKIACKNWNYQDDPQKVHRVLSPNCVFVLYARAIQIPTSPIVEVMPRRRRIRPSSHEMAIFPRRTNSFEHWPPGSAHPSFDTLAEDGLFYNGQGTIVHCFSCHGQITINRADDDPMSAHTNHCAFANHLRTHSHRVPFDFRPSTKVYELIDKRINNTTFYLLQKCPNNSTPEILLSAKIFLPNGEELETSDRNLRRLHPSNQLQQRVNWVTSSDGPLVNILKSLSDNPQDVSHIPEGLRRSTEDTSFVSMTTTNNPRFQCKTCLSNESSPHIVPIECGHAGLCWVDCFSKWMTCVICGYTLGKTIRIFNG